ncbi:MAG: molybdopterin oxidoreductase family protein [Bacteroidota bacterium]
MSEIKTHYRTCNICEAMCGLEIQYRDQEILSIRGDEKDPLSKGYLCPKAVALQDFHQDADRLQHPLQKTADGWEKISWDAAFAEIIERIQAIQERNGKDAVATYLGNPNAHNLGTLLNLPLFFKSLGTKNRYSSASADQLPHHVAAQFMFGNGMLMPIPDIDRTDFLMIIGGNPLVSNGSMMSAPGYGKRMKAIQQRGGKVVVLDPRRTETARKADEHHFIRPETDAWFLLGMLHTLFAEKLVNLRHLEQHVQGVVTVEQLLTDFAPERIAPYTELAATTIRRLAREMAQAKTAVCYSRMGASTQSFGGLCQWLTNLLNLFSGNFDRPGGAMFTQPAFDYVAMRSKKGKPHSYGRYQSRVRKLPYYNGEFPISTLAEEITTLGAGQIKALINIAGNPVLSSPNGKVLAEAFEQLEFMVAIDIYLNETSRHADIILPAATGLELAHYDFIFHVFAVRNTAKYAPALFSPKGEQRPDWEVLRRIAFGLNGRPDDGQRPEMMLDLALKTGPYAKEGMSLEYLKAHPHGVDLGPLRTCLLQRLQTADDAIHLAPEIFIADLNRLQSATFITTQAYAKYPFLLIGRRVLRSHNTWTHNAQRLMKGPNQCTLLLHPEDAAQLGLVNRQKAKVRSEKGSIEIEVQISDEMMRGVVSIPQGWGHRQQTQMQVAAQHPGVSINDLTDEQRIDALTGNAAFNGIPVAIES